MIATFSVPFRVDIKINEVEAFFEGREPAEGVATVIAVRHKPAGWFTDQETKFLVVLDNGTVGWADAKFCKAHLGNLPGGR